MINIQPIQSELLDAKPMVIFPLCLTLGDFSEFLKVYCPHRQKTVIGAWTDLQTWFWKHPQNINQN